jgi:hypothetical protein
LTISQRNARALHKYFSTYLAVDVRKWHNRLLALDLWPFRIPRTERFAVAKREVTPQELIAVEDDLHKIAGDIKGIRRLVEAEGELSVPLDLGTVLYNVNWLKAWSGKNLGAAPGALLAKKKGRTSPPKSRKS